MLVGVYIFQTLGIFGFMSWVPTLLAAHGFPLVKSLFSVTIMDVGAPVGAVIAALISDKWERKYLITVVALIIAGFGISYGLSSQMALIVIFGFCVSMFLQTFAPLLYAYTPECFPTAIRSLRLRRRRWRLPAGQRLWAYDCRFPVFELRIQECVRVYRCHMADGGSDCRRIGPKTKGQALA